MATNLIAWMLTYLLHSTLLLGLAWLVSKPLGRWSVAAEETVWKLALVGALFTASLQLAAGWEPAGGRWGLADLASPAVQATEAGAVDAALPRALAAAAPSALPAGPAADATSPASRWEMPSIPVLALGLWLAGALLLVAGFGRSVLRLGRRLRSRPRVIGGTLYTQLRELAAEAGLSGPVRLSCSWRVPVPVALGLRRPEICVPPRALAGLTEEQQQGMLAHELAHLARRDPFWLLVGQTISCVLFFQPLNWVARRRLREISEMLSDEWAVARTGRPLSLAGCLAEVAGWSVNARRLPVPGMADRPSNLARRIRRLLDESRSPESPARRFWLGAAMVALLIVVAAAAPAISAVRTGEPVEPGETVAPTTPALAALAALGSPEPPRDHEERAARDQARGRHDQDMDDDDDEGEDDDDGDSDEYDIHVDLEDLGVNLEDLHVDVSGLDDLASLADLGDLGDLGDLAELGDLGELADDQLEAAMAALDASKEALDETLDDDSGIRHRTLNPEERRKLEKEIERTTRRINEELRPRMEQLSRQMAERSGRMKMTPEMQRTIEEMRKLGERMRPSPEEMARLHATIDEEVRKHRKDGEMSREERERISLEAREMARRMRPSDEQRRQLDQLRHQLDQQREEMRSRYDRENRGEIEKAQREILEQVEQEMKAVREELRRVQEQRRQMDRDEHRQHRKDAKPRHDRDRDDDDGDHDDDHDDDDDGGHGKPNRQVHVRLSALDAAARAGLACNN